MVKYDNVLILCIDRDGDILSKAGTKGPIIGRDNVLSVATKLGLADPSDSDTNVLFAGVKLLDDLQGRYKNVEVVALTGSENVGVESDQIISKQLDRVLEEIPTEGIILVTDGAEDESVLPIVESRAKVISLKRVVVKQSEALESTYYIILDFLKEVTSDPKLARLVLGVPGIAFILYMIFPNNVWRVIAGVVGILLLIKGFNLEDPLDRNIASLRESLVTDKASFFTYIIAALVAVVGLIRGYQTLELAGPSYIEQIPFFIFASKDLLAAAVLLALAGRSLDALIEGRELGKYLILATFLVALWFIVGAISSFILRATTVFDLVESVTIGAGLSLAAFLLRKAVSKEQ